MATIGGRRLKERGKPCPYCGQPMRQGRSRPSPDHLWPRSKGGASGLNIVYACQQCNHDKAEMTIDEWLAKLERNSDRRARHVKAFIADAPSRLHMNWRDLGRDGGVQKVPEHRVNKVHRKSTD